MRDRSPCPKIPRHPLLCRIMDPCLRGQLLCHRVLPGIAVHFPKQIQEAFTGIARLAAHLPFLPSSALSRSRVMPLSPIAMSPKDPPALFFRSGSAPLAIKPMIMLRYPASPFLRYRPSLCTMASPFASCALGSQSNASIFRAISQSSDRHQASKHEMPSLSRKPGSRPISISHTTDGNQLLLAAWQSAEPPLPSTAIGSAPFPTSILAASTRGCS